MNRGFDGFEADGLHFFGVVSAVVSHEIKNTLAIINENAGLLEDYCLMAEKGMAIDPERLKKLAATLKRQIRRGNEIVANMNQFAHSTDNPIHRIDLVRMAAMVTALFHRVANGKKVILETVFSETPVWIETSPFLMEQLLWRLLEAAVSIVGIEGRVTLMVQPDDMGASIRLICSPWKASDDMTEFPAVAEREMMNKLKIGLSLDSGAGVVALAIPEDFQFDSQP